MDQNEQFNLLFEKVKSDAKCFEENHRGRIIELLNQCKKYQGEYIPSDHGTGSWATTYSNEFIDAAAEIYYIFESSYLFKAKSELSKLFISNNIYSCRGSVMDLDRVEYLYDKHLKSKLKNYS